VLQVAKAVAGKKMQLETTPSLNTGLTFNDLGLAEPILRAIKDVGYTTPTPIQNKAIPLVLNGGDLLAGAQTGTGKTAGFTLPLLHLLQANPKQAKAGQPRCLILTPTRELAAQIDESVKIYGKYLQMKSMVIFGGVNINPQINRLHKPVDIVVATPGRLLDLANQKAIDLSAVEFLVLDEADRMLDMGFIHDIKKVLAKLPKQRQNLLFSATFSDDIKKLADGLLNKPDFIEVARRNTASELVEQTVHLVKQAHKTALLSYLIKTNDWHQVLVFTRTKHGANRLAEKLIKDDIPAAAIHGNKSQSARTKALADFKNGNIPVLVATDIAARGLDIDQLPQVVNFELPNVPEDYVHRIGRTGRAGSSGAAISLVDFEEAKYLKDIEKLIKREIPKVAVDGFDAPTHIEPEPPRAPRPPQGRSPQNNGQAKTNNAPNNRQAGPNIMASNKPNGKPMSEAARHQAMPQTGLFAPKPQNGNGHFRSSTTGAKTGSGKPNHGANTGRPNTTRQNNQSGGRGR